jgi:predicted dehydrogenase
MSNKVRWGVLSAAKIAIEKVIPAMQQGELCEVVAIASRDPARAEHAAKNLGIARAYGSYEALLDDPDIEAVYNPLPNHLHVPWSIRAAEAGKHVLCEKPIAMNLEEAKTLLAARDTTRVKIQEAFMVHTHPQWTGALELVRSGRIGEPRSVFGYFSYFNQDASNIRNIAEYGGGGLMDIGCYLITVSRRIFGREPSRVVGVSEFDPKTRIDLLSSGILDFSPGQAVFTCGTQVAAYQRVHIVGTSGRIEIEIPFNAPPDRPCRVFLDDATDLHGGGVRTIEFDTCDQYTIQGDLFSKAIRENEPPPLPLEDSLRNMAVIDALARSAASGRWEVPLSWI